MFLLSVLKDFEIWQKKVYNEAIWLTKHFNKNYFIHFSGDARKTAVMKVWKIVRKTYLVEFLLRNSSCPIYPPITRPKTDSTANASFVFLFQEL